MATQYDVRWTSTPICDGVSGVTFTVTAAKKTDGSPLTAATTRAEVFVTSAVSPPACDDATRHPGLDTSPHGHAGYHITVR